MIEYIKNRVEDILTSIKVAKDNAPVKVETPAESTEEIK